MSYTLTRGGIEPLTHRPREQTQHLTAATYTLPGRTIIRLVPDALVEAEDHTLATIGAQPVSHTPVGYTTPRAIGFPAWPILSDPDNAHHALHLVGDLEWARRRAGSAKTKVKERLDQLAATLSASAPHFVPTLLEEAARIFAAADNLTYAGQMFNKARETERTHSLAVDPQRHRVMFQEFTALGVVGIKALRTEATTAPARDGNPDETLDYLIGLNATRLRAGYGPYRGMMRDLRAAGKIAGLSAADTDDRFLDAVVGIPGVLHASADFLTGVRDSLVRYARTRPAVRALVLHTRPQELDTDGYLALLEDCGALAEIRTTPKEWAEWLLQLIADVPGRPDSQGALVDLVLDTRQQLAGRQVQLPLRYVNLDVLDALLECGVRIAGPESQLWYHSVNWSSWLQATTGVRERALQYLAADPVLGEDARQALRSVEIRAHADVLLAVPGARQILSEVLGRYRTQRDGPALSVAGLREFHATAVDLAQPTIAAHLPEPLRKVLDVDAAALLQDSIRGGVLAELTWPAAEASTHRLCAQADTQDYRLFSTYPAVAVVAGRYLEVIDGDQVVAAGQLPEEVDWIFGVQHVDDTAVCYYRDVDGDYIAYWLHNQTATPVTDSDSTFSAVTYSLPHKNGRLTGKGHLSVGDTTCFGPAPTVLSTDPDTAVTLAADSHSRIHRWDGETFHPVQLTAEQLTGELGLRELGLDLPPLGPDAEIRLEHCTLVPAQPHTATSPLGTVNGIHAQIHLTQNGQTRIITAFGTVDAHDCPAALRRPGGGVWLRDSHRLIDHDTGCDLDLTGRNTTPMRMIERFPLTTLHQTIPRDAAASTRMRSYPRTHAEDLLHALQAGDGSHTDVIATQLRTDDPELIDAVTSLAQAVHSVAADYAALRQTAGLDHHTTTPEPELTISAAAHHLLNPEQTAHPGTDIATTHHPHTDAGIAGLLRHAHRPDATPTDDHGLHVTGWNRIIGNETLLIARSLGPLARRFWPPQARREVTDLVRTMIDAGLLCGPWHTAYLIEPKRYDRTTHVPFQAVIDHAVTFHPSGHWNLQDGQVYPVLLTDHRPALRGTPLTHPRTWPMPAPKLRAVLDAADALDPHDTIPLDQLDHTAMDRITAHTGLLPETLLYLLSRTPGYHGYEKLDKTTRDLFGFSTTHATAVLIQTRELRGHWDNIVCAAVPADDPVSFLHGTIDADAVIRYWHQEFGAPVMRLEASDYAAIRSHWHMFDHLFIDILTPVELSHLPESVSLRDLHTYLSTLLQIIQLRSWNAHERAFFAAKLRWLTTQATHHTAGHDDLYAAELGTDYHDPKVHTLAEPFDHGIRVLLEGHLDELITDLNHPAHTHGCPWDPRTSAPDTVRAIEQHHDLPEESATYYLQLLALTEPTDTNIRAWNSWRTKDIDTAAAPLVDKGLVLEAKRPGARRTRFIPGGWLPAAPGSTATEAWKAPLYLLWRDTKARPVVWASPLLSTHRQLFTDAWQRVCDGDTPGYEQLRTDRYRRRR